MVQRLNTFPVRVLLPAEYPLCQPTHTHLYNIGIRRRSSTTSAIRIGDVVRCKLHDDGALFYEGVVLEDYYDGTYLIDFGVDQSNEVVHLLQLQKV